MEPIFSRGALPQEQARFRRVDEDFRVILSGIEGDKRVLQLVERDSGLEERLPSMIIQLEQCQKALSDFLEQKRSAFPRFYFLGDDDLLEILGQASNPTVIQAHLKKLFQGVNTVTFESKGSETFITAINALEGERVKLKIPVQVTASVEDWMLQLSEVIVLIMFGRISTMMI